MLVLIVLKLIADTLFVCIHGQPPPIKSNWSIYCRPNNFQVHLILRFLGVLLKLVKLNGRKLIKMIYMHREKSKFAKINGQKKLDFQKFAKINQRKN